MKVKIISKSNNLLDAMYVGARNCYHSGTPLDIDVDNIPEDKKIALVTKVLDMGHTSISEHGIVTFAIEGVSRALLAQLTRHRVGISFSVQSQRYVEIKEDINKIEYLSRYGLPEEVLPVAEKYFVLDWVDESKASKFWVASQMLDALYNYLFLTQNGVLAEDARMFLPNAMKTNVVMSVNLRALTNFCNERMCVKAQKEIRQLANCLKENLVLQYEWYGKYLTPKCVRYGTCKEKDGCKNV